MVWFRRKPSASPVPYTWTQDLWIEAFLGTGRRFHGLALITSLHKRHELHLKERSRPDFETQSVYFGHLTREAGSSLNHVGVRLSFDTQLTTVPDSAVGVATTQEWQESYKAPCYLGLTVRATEEGALEFERVFHRAKANRQDYVPLWLSAENPAPPIDSDGFACVQPLSSITFQQEVSLVGKPSRMGRASRVALEFADTR